MAPDDLRAALEHRERAFEAASARLRDMTEQRDDLTRRLAEAEAVLRIVWRRFHRMDVPWADAYLAVRDYLAPLEEVDS